MQISPEIMEKWDPVAQFLVSYLQSAKGNKPISIEQVAKAFWRTRRKQNDGDNAWRKYLNTTKQQAIFLARQGVIELVRRGEPVDPNDFKGVIRLRLK